MLYISRILLIFTYLYVSVQGTFSGQIFHSPLTIKDEDRPHVNSTEPSACSDYMEVRLWVGDVEVDLYLELNSRLQDIPLHISDGNTIKLWNPQARSLRCPYQDVTRGAIVTVTKHEGNNKMAGIFHYNDNAYEVRPIVGKASIHKRSIDDAQYDHVIKHLGHKKYTAPRKRMSRQKRSGAYTVGITMVVDYSGYDSIYKTMMDSGYNVDGATEDDYKTWALGDTYAFASHIANVIDFSYGSIPDPYIRVIPLDIFVSTDPSTSEWTEADARVVNDIGSIDGDKALDDFGEWLSETGRHYIPESDSVMLFTGKDIATDRDGVISPDVGGLAQFGTICTEEATSITEFGLSFSGAPIGAHELGHTLGFEHDGDGNSCPESDEYTMTPVGGLYDDNTYYQNVLTFSDCSIEYLKGKIQELDEDGNNCLEDNADSFPEFDDYVSTMLGQLFDETWQCAARAGKNSYFCGQDYDHDDPEWSMCRYIWCWDENEDPPGCYGWSTGSFAGTSCGEQKWCVKGTCTYDENAPTPNWLTKKKNKKHTKLSAENKGIEKTSRTASKDLLKRLMKLLTKEKKKARVIS